jgi:hypothetical protein
MSVIMESLMTSWLRNSSLGTMKTVFLFHLDSFAFRFQRIHIRYQHKLCSLAIIKALGCHISVQTTSEMSSSMSHKINQNGLLRTIIRNLSWTTMVCESIKPTLEWAYYQIRSRKENQISILRFWSKSK